MTISLEMSMKKLVKLTAQTLRGSFFMFSWNKEKCGDGVNEYLCFNRVVAYLTPIFINDMIIYTNEGGPTCMIL